MLTNESRFMNEQSVKTIETETLLVGYIEYGSVDGWPVILSHGFPYDVHASGISTSFSPSAGVNA